MRRLAIAFVVVGLGIGGYFWRRGPLVETPGVPLAWSTGPLDAGALDVQFSVSGVDFVRATDAEEPVLAFAVLRRGAQRVVLDDFNSFHVVERHGARLWVVAESTTEGPGSALEVLTSDDDGVSFTRRTVPKPHYLAMFEGLEVDGDDARLRLSLDDELFATDEWTWWIWQYAPTPLKPLLRTGHFNLHTRNGGRTWRLER